MEIDLWYRIYIHSMSVYGAGTLWIHWGFSPLTLMGKSKSTMQCIVVDFAADYLFRIHSGKSVPKSAWFDVNLLLQFSADLLRKFSAANPLHVDLPLMSPLIICKSPFTIVASVLNWNHATVLNETDARATSLTYNGVRGFSAIFAVKSDGTSDRLSLQCRCEIPYLALFLFYFELKTK